MQLIMQLITQLTTYATNYATNHATNHATEYMMSSHATAENTKYAYAQYECTPYGIHQNKRKFY